jgi:hypothetical protein
MWVDVRVAQDARDRNEVATDSGDEIAVEILTGDGIDLAAGRCARPTRAGDHESR